MNGVTIMDSYTGYSIYVVCILGILFSIILFICFLSILIKTVKNRRIGRKESIVFPVIFTAVMFVCVVMSVLCNPWNGIMGKADSTYYVCEVDSNVTLQEFVSQYRIISENYDGTFVVQRKG